MAKIKHGIFGPLSGKLGELIGSSWMGIAYLKKAPIVNKNAKRSPAQVANNKKFSYVNEWLIPFHPFLAIGFSSLAIRKTAIGAALSAVYKLMFTGTMPDIEIDYSKMQISSGSLGALSDLSISYSPDNEITMKWTENPGGNSKFNDQVILALYSEDLKLTDGFLFNVSRADKKYSFQLQKEMEGQLLHCYVAVVSFDRKKASNTMYLGQIKPS